MRVWPNDAMVASRAAQRASTTRSSYKEIYSALPDAKAREVGAILVRIKESALTRTSST